MPMLNRHRNDRNRHSIRFFFSLSLANFVTKAPALYFSLSKQGFSYKNRLGQRVGGEGEEKGLFSEQEASSLLPTLLLTKSSVSASASVCT